MGNDTSAAGGARRNPEALDPTDRILLGVCAAVWLIALGAGVAAVVALVDLSGKNVGTSGESETPWLLYTVIGVSAVVIVAAVPLLLRARRTAAEGGVPAPAGARPDQSVFGDPVQTTNLRAAGAPAIRRQPIPPPASGRVGFPTAAVEQIYLRCPVVIASAMGAATALIGIATYLAATEHEASAWAVYGVAGVIIVAMPVVPVIFLRQLRAVLA
jgi:Protein of unknown function (DUF2561)